MLPVSWRGVLAAALLSPTLFACAQPGPPQAASVCSAPLKSAVEVNLYFGRGKPSGGEVSDAEWATFLSGTVTPHFPEGLTVIDAHGQHRDPAGVIGAERTKLVVIVVFDAPAHRPKVASIVDTYTRRFGQHEVFRAEQPVCAGS
jgi:hypothetical protein